MRYFDPFDADHPLRYSGARNYRGQICYCEQGDRNNCGFHYPNGYPGYQQQQQEGETIEYTQEISEKLTQYIKEKKFEQIFASRYIDDCKRRDAELRKTDVIRSAMKRK